MNASTEGFIALLLCFMVLALIVLITEVRKNTDQHQKNGHQQEELLKDNLAIQEKILQQLERNRSDYEDRLKKLEAIFNTLNH